MINYLLVAIFSYLFGILSAIVISIIKGGSKCSKKEESKTDWFKYGQEAYEELERLENKRKESKANKENKGDVLKENDF